jgi:hypothetical protein
MLQHGFVRSFVPSQQHDIITMSNNCIPIIPSSIKVCHRSIVLLVPTRSERESSELVAAVRAFKDVFILFGDPQQFRASLRLAGVQRAYCIVVLAERQRGRSFVDGGMTKVSRQTSLFFVS